VSLNARRDRVAVVGDDAAKCGSQGFVFVVRQVKVRHLPDMGPRRYIVTGVTER
jgi:hypothetical protein